MSRNISYIQNFVYLVPYRFLIVSAEDKDTGHHLSLIAQSNNMQQHSFALPFFWWWSQRLSHPLAIYSSARACGRWGSAAHTRTTDWKKIIPFAGLSSSLAKHFHTHIAQLSIQQNWRMYCTSMCLYIVFSLFAELICLEKPVFKSSPFFSAWAALFHPQNTFVLVDRCSCTTVSRLLRILPAHKLLKFVSLMIQILFVCSGCCFVLWRKPVQLRWILWSIFWLFSLTTTSSQFLSSHMALWKNITNNPNAKTTASVFSSSESRFPMSLFFLQKTSVLRLMCPN